MKERAELGLAETNGEEGKHQIWNLTVRAVRLAGPEGVDRDFDRVG